VIDLLKRLFCKHKYVDRLKETEFFNLSGDTVVTICEKCGKVKCETFYTNEEMTMRYKGR